jgi:hypothetical protein
MPPVARASAAAFGVGVLVAAVGQLGALALFLAQGANGAYAPYLRLGAAYVALFHRVPVSLRLLPLGGESAAAVLSIALLLVTFATIALLALVGRRVPARDRSGGALVVVAAGVAYAVVPLALSFVASGRVPLPGDLTFAASVSLRVSAIPAFVVPFALASASVAFGAISVRTRERGDAFVADVVAGGVRSAGLLLVLAVAAVLVLASARPVVGQMYGAVVAAPDSPEGRAVIAGHLALLLPNQAIWVAVPAMGACDEVVLDGHATPFLCYWREPTALPLLPGSNGVIPGDAGFRRPPLAYLGFLAVPLIATVAGGVRAARGSTGTRHRALAGVCSGLAFAGLMVVAIALARIGLTIGGGFLGRSTFRLAIGPELLRGTVVSLAWGVGGGTLGAIGSGFVTGRTGAAGHDDSLRSEEPEP